MSAHREEQPAISDDKQRVYPGDPARREIRMVKPGVFDEDGPHVQLLEDEVEFPNGRRGTLVRVTRSPKADDGVVVVPVTEDDRIVLVRQFRHAPRIWTWELPRGATEAGKTPACAMHTELLQEIGYQPADAPFSLGRVIADSGTLHEIPYLFAVRVRPHPTRGPSPEPHESIVACAAIDYETLWRLCVTGALNDAFTMAAVMRLRPHFRDGRFEIDQRFVHKYSSFEYRSPEVPR